LVFDTSLLAAFDVPGVDPAAQQQAANLLSQQAYQPQSISPPSFSGGGGLAESRPQTVTQGAPYYDPIAIHQGAAPVNYQYSGPTVDMSAYLGLGTYMGIPRQPNQSTDYLNTVNEEFSTIDRGLANTIQGIQRGGPMPPENVINQLNYYNPLYDSQYQQPAPQYGTTNRPGTLAGLLDVQRAGQSQYGGLPGAALSAGIDLYNTDIPIYSDFARNFIKPAAETIGNLMPGMQGYNAIANALPYLPSTGQVASASVPVTLGDVGLEAVPGIGALPDAWRTASRLSPDLTDFSRVIREGGQNVSQRLGPSELGAARVPKTPDAINAISRRLKGGDEKPIFEGIEQVAETPAPPKPLPGTEAYARGRGTTAPPPDYSQDPGYLESLSRMVDSGGVANPARTKTTAPARRTIDMGDTKGTLVDATPENIQAATARYLARETTQRKIKADPETFWESAAEQIANAKTRGGRPLMQGVTPDEVKAALLEAGTINKLDVKATPDGNLTVSAVEDLETAVKRFDEGDLWSDGPPPPKRPTASSAGSGGGNGKRPLRGASAKAPLPKLEKAPAEGTLDKILSLANLPRLFLTGWDYSLPLRQGAYNAPRYPGKFKDAFVAGLKAIGSDEVAAQVQKNIDESGVSFINKAGEEAVGRPGLFISKLDGTASEREEAFISSLAGHIPGFRRFAQGNTTFINKFRADIYDARAAAMARGKMPVTEERLTNLGHYISETTGRGILGKGTGKSDTEALARAAGAVFFSPSYFLSLFQAPAHMFDADPFVRRAAIEDFLGFFGTTIGLITLADMSGAAEVNMDPRSSDFGKMKIGNTRIDPFRGYQQLARATYQLYQGTLGEGIERVSEGGAIYEESLEDAMFRFLRTKLSPQAGFGIDLWKGEDLLGREVKADVGNVARRLAPIGLQALYEAIEDGSQTGIALSMVGLLGIGVNTYESDGAKLNDKIAGMGFTDPTTGEAITEWHKLSNSQKSEAKERDPSITEVSTPSDITQRRNAENQSAWDTLKQTGDFDSYFAQHKAIGEKFDKEFEAQEFPDLKNPGEWAKKLDGYYAKLDEITNPSEEQAYREQFVAGLNPAEKEAFESQQSSDPNYRKLQQAMDLLQPRYYDLREAAFDELKVKVDKLSGFENYADVWAKGTSQDQQYVGSAMAGQLRQIRSADPQADAMLYILGRSDYVLTQQAKAIVDATLAKEGINKKSPNIGRP